MTPSPPPEALEHALRARYRLEGELGAGGMATVYRARDLRHERPVALKVVAPGPSAEIGAPRFEQEMRTAARLNHPHILPLFDSGEAAGLLYYVMPLIEGESLERRLARLGRLPTEEAVRLVADSGRALAYAHGQGVVHRDVKPANILLHHDEPLVADFGIALATEEGSRLTTAGLFLGTPRYTSPEQAGGESTVDGRADQYALACVLFEALEGHPPFEGKSARAVLTAHLVDDPPALSDATEGGGALSAVLRRALAKRPDDRFPDMSAFVDAVEAVLDGPGAAAEAGASEGEAKPGLVVLPFANLSSDPDNEYFSDGLTEEVIGDLSRIGALRVISRTSAMRLKHHDQDLGSLARTLDVRFVLEGGVRKAGDALRITARLVDAPSEETLWSERFSGTMEDVFEIQEQVARAIAEALRVRLSPAEDQALGQRTIADPRAYESYLRARHEAWRFSPEGLARATAAIEEALGIVGENEQLLGTLGHITAMHVESGIDTDPSTLQRLEDLASRIFALNPEADRGHWIRAFLAYFRGDMSEAVIAGERAVAAAPDDPDTRILLGYISALVGRTDRARELLPRALELDPLTPVTQLMPGFVAVVEGRYEDALEPYRRAWELDPESPMTGVFYGWALAHAGRHHAAIPFLDRVADRIGGGAFASWARSLARGLEGDADGVARAVTPALEEAGRGSQMFARGVSDAWALVGDADRGLQWLERAVELGLLNEPFLRHHARFLDPIRDDPRLEELLERVAERAATLPPSRDAG